MATADDFWTRVVIGSETECWPWKNAVFHMGHGACHFNGKQDRAHRVAWMLTNGPIPHGMCVLHRCDNPPCCNPSHLFLGTKSENTRDRHAKGRDARGERHGRYTKPHRNVPGERNGRALITNADALAIREMRINGAKNAEIGAQFNLSQSQVSRIALGKSWKHI